MDNLDMRHFIVFYKAIRKSDNAAITGYMEFNSDCYINKKITLEQIEETIPYGKDIVFTNIIELSKEDFENWSTPS